MTKNEKFPDRKNVLEYLKYTPDKTCQLCVVTLQSD